MVGQRLDTEVESARVQEEQVELDQRATKRTRHDVGGGEILNPHDGYKLNE